MKGLLEEENYNNMVKTIHDALSYGTVKNGFISFNKEKLTIQDDERPISVTTAENIVESMICYYQIIELD